LVKLAWLISEGKADICLRHIVEFKALSLGRAKVTKPVRNTAG
jgi:hypothetical protein